MGATGLTGPAGQAGAPGQSGPAGAPGVSASSERTCRGNRSYSITVPTRKGFGVISVRASVNGKLVSSTRKSAKIDLARADEGLYMARLTVTYARKASNGKQAAKKTATIVRYYGVFCS